MIRVTITVPEDLAMMANREARRLRTSVSGLVRQALRRQLGVEEGTSGRRPSFIGIGRSGRRHTARDAEAILEREWGGSARRR